MPKSGETEEKKVVQKKKETSNKTVKSNIDEKENSTKRKTTKKVEVTKAKKPTPKKKNTKVSSTTEKTTIKKESSPKKATSEQSIKSASISTQEVKIEKEFEEKPLEPSMKQVETEPKKVSSKNEFQTLEVVVLVVLSCIISLAAGGLLGLKFSGKEITNNQFEKTDKELREFIEDYNYLIDNYYGDIDKKALLDAAFKSMIDTLGDAYSGNIDDASSNNFDIELNGSYEGLGVEIINDSDKNVLVYDIIPNSPASKVDMKAGDKIISVNGQEITNMLTTEFINNIVKPTENKKFSIELERDGKRHTVEIKKEKIVLESVRSKKYIENNLRIGYIKVDIFAKNTYDQFKTQLNKLEKEGIDSLVIDLRDNTGGDLKVVSDMISLFLDSSHVIYQTESNSKKEKVYSTGKTTKDYPIVLLGNATSASASEVMIGALTEEYGAILVGNKTFGKGTVQELHSLSNGDEYKFTTKKWLTPKGVWVHNQGIAPKVEVSLSKEYYTNPVEANDNQLRRALDYLIGLR